MAELPVLSLWLKTFFEPMHGPNTEPLGQQVKHIQH